MILASKSPRRKEILENFGFNLKIFTPDIDEISDEIEVIDQIEDIARKKALHVGKKFENEYILAADTVVVLNGKIFGKPQGEDEAKEMLKLLSNETHEVITAYCLINFQKKIEIISHNITKVKFKNLDEELINWYISTKEPLDKAGAYGIQGKGAILIEKIEGDFFSVMGLPIGKIVSDLLGTGLKLDELNKI